MVEQGYVKLYAETCSANQLDFILQFCQYTRYQQLMRLEVQMIQDTLAVNEKYDSIIQHAALKPVQDVLL